MGWTAGDLASILNARVHGKPDRWIEDVNDPEEAGPREAVILFHPDLTEVPRTRAGTIISRHDLYDDSIKATWLLVDDPMAVLDWFYLQWYESCLTAPHPYSPDRSDIRMGEGCQISPHALIGPEVQIGDRTRIGAGAILLGHLRIGNDCVIEPGAVIFPRVVIGDRVRIKATAVIGSDGFRVLPGSPPRRIPHIGRVMIGDDVLIGAGTCIDRSITGVTRIESGCHLDNLVQVAHNVRVGRDTIIAAQTGIAGSARIGSRVLIGGQVGISDHSKIGDAVRIAARSGVMGSIKNGETVSGTPSMPHSRWLRLQAILRQLPDIWPVLQKRLKKEDTRDSIENVSGE